MIKPRLSGYVEIQLESPSEYILGFSGKPKTEKELMGLKAFELKWYKNQSKLISFDGLSCKKIESDIELNEIDDNKTVLLGSLVIQCDGIADESLFKTRIFKLYNKIKLVTVEFGGSVKKMVRKTLTSVL